MHGPASFFAPSSWPSRTEHGVDGRDLVGEDGDDDEEDQDRQPDDRVPLAEDVAEGVPPERCAALSG